MSIWDYWIDDMTPWPPRVLVVSTHGVEIESLMFSDPGENIHWCQSWKAITCRCGVVHRPCDDSELALVVGKRDRQIHFHPKALVVFVLPRPSRRLPPETAQIVWDDIGSFGPWAADVVLNMAAPLSSPVRWTYDIEEMKRVLAFAPIWRCLRLNGGPRKLADEIEQAVGLRPSALEALHLSLAIPDSMNLGDVRLKTYELYSGSAPASVIITTSTAASGPIGTLLYASRDAE